jgi:uncharacterized protein YneF (UPF0154 family)
MLGFWGWMTVAFLLGVLVGAFVVVIIMDRILESASPLVDVGADLAERFLGVKPKDKRK